MERKILRLKEAKPILDSIHKHLVSSIHEGFEDWLKIREFINNFEGGPVNYKPRTKAGIIHEHIEKYIRINLADTEGVIIDEFNGVFGIHLQDELFIRFKKMDKDYATSNISTRQHRTFIKQGQIEGFPEKPTFLFAGYLPDNTWSTIKGVYVACWVGKNLEWVDEFGKYSVEQTILDFNEKEKEPFIEIEKRIKIKRAIGEDEKSNPAS
ncbi:MAG TPA: hypothetical protein VL053_03170 [Arachidicoccus sp.]|nr:hypothetical protein [Arachidicoccus sp.]